MSVCHTFQLPKKCVKVFSKSGHNRDKNLIGWRVQASFDMLRDLLFAHWLLRLLQKAAPSFTFPFAAGTNQQI